ncbi:hypothetical protein GCM10010502_38180 [Kitasatospora aureofaciens]|uniref:DUF2382 domain-containing protein n=1 Tax=Kitasatospora aureofaciens TaxID=1894 RepID=A0A8H9HST3_KITAU|nr:hypothetical protein GCM10010502_38180 [Kitasatospora aureofaciens]
MERVRLVTEEHVEQETVSGRGRKERIEANLPSETEQQMRGKGVRGEDRRR